MMIKGKMPKITRKVIGPVATKTSTFFLILKAYMVRAIVVRARVTPVMITVSEAELE